MTKHLHSLSLCKCCHWIWLYIGLLLIVKQDLPRKIGRRDDLSRRIPWTGRELNPRRMDFQTDPVRIFRRIQTKFASKIINLTSSVSTLLADELVEVTLIGSFN